MPSVDPANTTPGMAAGAAELAPMHTSGMTAINPANGKILWKVDTAGRTYDTTNGIKGLRGGGIDGNGPTIAQGTVFVTSGFDGASNYGSTGAGTNVLLAYTVDGK